MTHAPLNRIRDYEILCALKAGGMGQVFLGRRVGAHGFEKLVAVKTLRAELDRDSGSRTMFLDEARLLARLDHPAVAQVSDFGEIDEYLFIVMEYVAGVSMAELLHELDRPLPPRVAADLMARVCRGLDAAHKMKDDHGRSLGVVHRDVSPQNIMISYAGAPKLIDFGIALHRARSTPVTEYGTVKGKPCYMAPEQFRSDPLDHRVDVFAACVVLHEALTHCRLFHGDSVYAVGMAVCDGTIEPPSATVPGLPPALDEIVMQGLQKDPAARYASCADLAKDLETWSHQQSREDLREFAERMLAAKTAAHTDFLARARQGTHQRPDAQEPPTVPLPGTAHTVPLLNRQLESTMIRAPGTDSPPGSSGKRPSRKSTGRRFALVVAFLAAGGLGVGLIATQLEPGTETPTPPATRPANTDRPGATTTSDAAQPPSVDAGGNLTEKKAPTRAKSYRVSKGRRSKDKRGSAKSRRAGGVVVAATDVTAKSEDRALVTFLAKGAYAIIRLDGKNLGPTPIMAHQTTAGAHVVEFVDPKSNDILKTAPINLAPDEHKKVWAPSR
ncbi:serine/threonine protein kinase [Myxococcota bacterium]